MFKALLLVIALVVAGFVVSDFYNNSVAPAVSKYSNGVMSDPYANQVKAGKTIKLISAGDIGKLGN